MPGGPYSRIPFHGVRLPVKRCGNLIGRMTASLSEAFAPSRPATSSHLTLGFSVRMAPARPARSFLVSGSWSSSSPSFLYARQYSTYTHWLQSTYDLPVGPEAPPAPLTPTALLPFFSVVRCSLSVSARPRYSLILDFISSLDFSFFSSTQVGKQTIGRASQ